MFVINADTPEQMRDAIVQWLNDQASNKRRTAMMARNKTLMNAAQNEGFGYEQAATFIQNITIEPLRKPRT